MRVRGEYKIPELKIEEIISTIRAGLNAPAENGSPTHEWFVQRLGDSVRLIRNPFIQASLQERDPDPQRNWTKWVLKPELTNEGYEKGIKGWAPETPVWLEILIIQRLPGEEKIHVDVSCDPAMSLKIQQGYETEFTRQGIEKVHKRCRKFIKEVMVDILQGREIKAPWAR